MVIKRVSQGESTGTLKTGPREGWFFRVNTTQRFFWKVLDGHEFGLCSEKYPQPSTVPGKELLLGAQELEGAKEEVPGGVW